MTQNLYHLVIRVPKKEAAFVYFQLEAREGLCFHSTLDQSLKQPYRDIEIFATSELQSELQHLIDMLSQDFPIEFLTKEVIPDNKDYGLYNNGK
jgi:hypothetical protein